jgi:HD-GYP domain-containing protein (c-di-GMP phosphodiesterase class II)
VRNTIALRILRVAAGTQFDPELVEALRLFQKSIPGSEHVELTTRNCFDSQ